MPQAPSAPHREDDERYDAIRCRNSQNGEFFFAVRTTGVYCRPACAARTPLRKNVVFFENGNAAIEAGYRPCKRCRPDAENPEPLATEIDTACRAIDASDAPVTLAVLAAAAGVSAFHFQRAFRKRVGVTPKQYELARRERNLETALATAESVTAAALDAGFSSSAAIYESGGIAASMRPQTYRRGGAGERIAFAIERTSIGWLLVASTPRGICALDLDDDRAALEARLRERFNAATIVGSEAELADAVASAVAIVEGRKLGSDLPLDIRGTAFQRRVWQELRSTPPGTTRTYAEIATAIGAPAASRAVGNAIGSNVLAIAIPCHRVVRGDGQLGGYRWGVERKRTLLARERKEVS